MVEPEPDYLHEDSTWLRARIAVLHEDALAAQAEAAHARALRVGLDGPANAADQAKSDIGLRIGLLEAMIDRVDCGYPYYEREGFRIAIDACGEIDTWQPLADIPVRGGALAAAF